MTNETHSAPAGLTIRDALEAAEAAGFGEQLVPAGNGWLRTVDSSLELHGSELLCRLIWRIEGASDAADQLLVVAFESETGPSGTVLLTYGPNASEDDSSVLVELDLSTADAGRAPGIER